jgi:carboxypeptidase C (cathepsin A)
MAFMAGVVSLASGVTSAAETTETATAVEKSTTDATPPPSPRSQSTRHQLTLDGKVLNYTATVGWLILKDDKKRKESKDSKNSEEKPIARFGYTAYTLDGVKDPSRRPVISLSMEARARHRSGCTWQFSVEARRCQ